MYNYIIIYFIYKLTSVVFLPNNKYVAKTSSYFACAKESSISLREYPIFASASVIKSFDRHSEIKYYLFFILIKKYKKRKQHKYLFSSTYLF